MKYLLFFCIFQLFSLTSSAQTAPPLDSIQGAQVGDTIKNFILKDQNGQNFQLEEALKKGPIVLIFYRGQWCPYCNKHLSNLQDSLPLIAAKGAQVIALSPENPEYLEKMEVKTGAKFTLLYDSAYQIARYMDVLFDPGERLIHKYDRISGNRLNEVHGTENALLPVPATFIINKEGIIIWRHFDKNYRERSGVDIILRELP